MMFKRQSTVITHWQLFALVGNAMLGFGVFTLARVIGQVAGRGALLTIPLAGIVVLLQLGGMFLLARRFPRQTLGEYVGQILGSTLGKIYLMGYALLAAVLIVIVSRNFWLLSSNYTLGKTPQAVLLVPLLLVGWNAVRRGVVATARLVELVTYANLGLMLLVVIPFVPLDWDFVRPVLDSGWASVLRGIIPVYLALLGFDVVLFVYPFVPPRNAYWVAAAAVLAIVVFYTVITLYVFATLSPELAVLCTWPLQNYLNKMAFTLFERIDIIFLISWTSHMLTTNIVALFTGTSCLQGVFPSLSWQRSADVFLLPTVIGVMLPIHFATHERWQSIYSLLTFFYVGMFPFFLWLLAVVRGKKGDQDEARQKSTV